MSRVGQWILFYNLQRVSFYKCTMENSVWEGLETNITFFSFLVHLMVHHFWYIHGG